MKKIIFHTLAIVTVLMGCVSCSGDDNPSQSPLSLIRMSILPDYSDGSIQCDPSPIGLSGDGLLSFKVEILPLTYLDQFGRDDKYTYRATFRMVETGNGSVSHDFSLDGTIRRYEGDDCLTASFVLKPDVMEKLKANDYRVSFFIGDAAAALGVSTASVPLSSDKPGLVPDEETDILLFGQGKASVKESAGIKGNMVKWVQLWEKGPKFAEYNVGVTDVRAGNCGGYYCWGNSDEQSRTYKDGNQPLSDLDDIATRLWGSNWRMPTDVEFQELLANCDVEWTSKDGISGRMFIGKDDYSCDSVFFPVAGYCYAGDVYDKGFGGVYWSSTPNGNDYAYFLSFSSNIQTVFYGGRDFGYSVRAVLKEN